MNGDVERVRMLLGQRNHNPNVRHRAHHAHTGTVSHVIVCYYIISFYHLKFFSSSHNTHTTHVHTMQMRDESGYTALHYACRNGKLEVGKLLVAKGASVNVQVSV